MSPMVCSMRLQKSKHEVPILIYHALLFQMLMVYGLEIRALRLANSALNCKTALKKQNVNFL
jgi:hypothetical protein